MNHDNIITIYHTNDLHDHRRAVTMAGELPRDQNTLLVDSGDAIGGSNTAFRFREPVIDLMNRAGYDCMAMGNREFNYLRGVLRIRARQANFPILCANLVDTRGKTNDTFTPWITREIAGIKIGIIGLTPVMYPDESIWFRLSGFSFRDPTESMARHLPQMRQDSDMVVVLSHLGLDRDRHLALQIPGLDLIIGGHSHKLLEKPERTGDGFIFNGGCHGRYIGRIQFTPQKTAQGKVMVRNLEYSLIRVAGKTSGDASP